MNERRSQCAFASSKKLFFTSSVTLNVDRQDVGVAGELIVVEFLVRSGILCHRVFIKAFWPYTDAILAVGWSRQNTFADGGPKSHAGSHSPSR
jgi:hypothetical protein